MPVSLFTNTDFQLLLGSVAFVVCIGLYITFEDDIRKAVRKISKNEDDVGSDIIENSGEPATLYIREVNNSGKLIRTHTIENCDPGEDDGDTWDATFTDDDSEELHINSYQVQAIAHYRQASGNSIYWDYNKNGFGDVIVRQNVSLQQTVSRLNLENRALLSQLKDKSIDSRELARMNREEQGSKYRSPTPKGERQFEKFGKFDKDKKGKKESGEDYGEDEDNATGEEEFEE